jgi:hypothetical protein
MGNVAGDVALAAVRFAAAKAGSKQRVFVSSSDSLPARDEQFDNRWECAS